MLFRIFCTSAATLLLVTIGHAQDTSSVPTYGWRGNWTGLYPDANPPLTWSRVPHGVLEGLTCQAAQPNDDPAQRGQPVERGLLREWLILGPLMVADAARDLSQEQVPHESRLAPQDGERVGGLAWQRLTVKKKPDYEAWGTTELDWVDVGEALGFQPNAVGYACTHIRAERAGKAVFVVDHGFGLKAWLNGTLVYEQAERRQGLGNYVGLSRQKQELVHHVSPKFELPLRKGWNRLLVKISSHPTGAWREMKFAARLYDPDPAAYREQNIAWMTELPERSNACPLIVGDRIFSPAEPDELVCLDKVTGKVLWRRTNTLWEATPAVEQAAYSERETLDSLVAQLAETTQTMRGVELRHQLQELLTQADPRKFKLRWDGHFASHFGIIGFTTTPVSDGQAVYAFFGYGVVACYDFAGNRRWIRRLDAKQVGYTCSPALSGGKLFCVFGGLHALEPVSGQEQWAAPEASCIASLIPLRVGTTDAVTLQGHAVYRSADGRVLWKDPNQGGGWGAPLFQDQSLYMLILGVSDLRVADFAGCHGDAWAAKYRRFEIATEHRRPNGEWLDRSSPGSPLVWQGLCYAIDEYGVLYCLELETGKTLYRQETGFDELHSYNHVGVAASPTLIGRHVAVMDNQGWCLVFEPGPVFKQVALNKIETMLPRDWPIPPQETIANGPPVVSGDRIYIRGERYLYCLGAK